MLEKKPFQSYRLPEEKINDKSMVIPVRANLQEQAMIQAIKEQLNIHSDSKALKIAARVGLDVLQQTFTPKVLSYLCKEKRERLSDYKDFINTK